MGGEEQPEQERANAAHEPEEHRGRLLLGLVYLLAHRAGTLVEVHAVLAAVDGLAVLVLTHCAVKAAQGLAAHEATATVPHRRTPPPMSATHMLPATG